MSRTTTSSGRIVVLGAGVAGLRAAVEALERGYDALLIEKAPERDPVRLRDRASVGPFPGVIGVPPSWGSTAILVGVSGGRARR